MSSLQTKTSVDTPRSLIRPYYPALNGLRGLSIFMVFTSHYGKFLAKGYWTMGLWEGVDVFFVLSGFLITGILYDSKNSTHFFRNFYLRRALRIFPLYYSFFFVIWLLTPVLHLFYQRVMWSNLLYIANLTRMHTEVRNPTVIFLPRFKNGVIVMGALWSLCVEEQFYLVWPLLVRLLPSRSAMMRFCIAAMVTTLSLRTFLWFWNPALVAQTHYLYFVTYTRCDTLFLGAWLALWLRGVSLTLEQVRRIAYTLILLPGTILILGEATIGRRWEFNEVNPLLCTYGYTLIAFVALGVLMLALDERSRFTACSKIGTLLPWESLVMASTSSTECQSKCSRG